VFSFVDFDRATAYGHKLLNTVLQLRKFFAALSSPAGKRMENPGPSFEDPPVGRTLEQMLRECLFFPGHLLTIAIALACVGGARVYLIWLAKSWADGPLRTGDHHALMALIARGSATMLSLMIGLFSSRYLLKSFEQRFVQNIRDRAQHRLLQIELSAARRFRVGELVSRLSNDTGVLGQFMHEILQKCVGESIVLIGDLVLLFRLDWRLAPILALAGPLVGVVLSYFGRFARRRSAQARRELGLLSALATEQLRGITTIKGFQSEALERDRFAAKSLQYREQVLGSEFWLALMETAALVVASAALLAVAWFGTAQVVSGRKTIGSLILFCLCGVQAMESLRRMSEVQGLLQHALAAAARVFEIIDLPGLEQKGTMPLPNEVLGAIRFEGVRFAYPNGADVLCDLNLSIAPRQTIAIVAASGGGKSTIANLLMRFIEPTAGRILFDGVELAHAKLSHVRRKICLVEQEPFVFSGSLLENLTYPSSLVPRNKIEEAVALAGLDQFVASLPGGLESHLEESGSNVSGGQYQRIALARAILSDPAVLILDEATSALDSETEHSIFIRMQSWLARRTVLVMSHRFATLSRFQRVVVLNNGRVVGVDSPTELLRSCAVFRRLFAEQISPLENTQKVLPAAS
jgi:ABC-type multidrug transport system fused ATPase/permease subunit